MAAPPSVKSNPRLAQQGGKLKFKITTNIEKGLGNKRVVLVGPPASGKTTSAMTVSEILPDDWVPMKGGPIYKLEDTLHVGFDSNAGYCLGPIGLVVPLLDFDDLYWECGRDIMETLPHLCGIVIAAVEQGGYKNVVFDTVSKLNLELKNYWLAEENCPVSRKTGEPDTQAAWGKVLKEHANFHGVMSKLPVNIVWVTHPMYIDDTPMTKLSAEKRREATFPDKEARIVMAINGQGAGPYRNDNDIICSVQRKRNHKTKQDEVLFFTKVENDFECKNRFRFDVPEICPPNIKMMYRPVEESFNRVREATIGVQT